MSNLALMRVMLLKEIRTTFRERSQIRALLISVLAMFLATGGNLSRLFKSSHHVAGHHGWVAHTAQQLAVLHWVEIGAAAMIGMFFSMGYLISSILASFVGEKESRTLEILLASPVSDRKLYVLKCISVLLPSAGIGYALAIFASAIAMIFIPPDVIVFPMNTLLYTALLSVPVMLIPQLWFVAAGAAISVKAETLKGAAQILSGIFMFVIFGGIYGVPMLLAQVPALRESFQSSAAAWINWSFIVQYGSVLGLLALSAAVCLLSGRIFFRRDRMLT